MATRFTEVEKRPIYPIYLPQDVNPLQAEVGNYISMKNYNHARIVIFAGAIAASCAVLIKRAKSVTGTDAESWTGWDYMQLNANPSSYNGEDASDTKLTTKTAVTSYTYAIAAANKQIEIEFDAIDLGGGDWDCFTVALADPANTDIICAFVELSGSRFSGVDSEPPTARSN